MESYFEGLITKIDKALLKGINPQKSSLDKAIHYALSLRGKRIRPLLFLTLIDVYKKSLPDYIDIACAIEYIHTYSLIHDDLPAMDDDDFRRGMPTVHKKFNEALALLAGDTLLTLAIERITLTSLAPVTIIQILTILTSSIGINGMAGVQALDLEFKGDKHIISRIHSMKTAELIKGTLLAAAEIINMDKNKKKVLARAGGLIGIAFQMADDLLDIEGDEKEVGKKLNKDKLNKSPNAVLFWGKNYVKNTIDEYYAKSLELLKSIPIESSYLFDLIARMVYRKK